MAIFNDSLGPTMQSLLCLSDSAAASAVPGSMLVPSPVTFAIHMLNRVHCVWRWHFMFSQVMVNTGNLKKYIAGTVINYCAADLLPGSLNLILRIAAQVTLAAARITALGKQKIRTYHACKNFYNAITLQQPLRIRIRLADNDALFLRKHLGPDSAIWVLRKKEALRIYSTRVLLCALELLRQMFYTSMCYMDVIEVFTLNPAVKNEAMNQLFISASSVLDDISKNKQHIHAELLRNQRLIEQILSGLGNPCRAEQLISVVSTSLNVAERTYNAAGWVWGCTQDFVKVGVETVCHVNMGYVPSWMPTWLMPDDPNPVEPLPN